MAKHGALPDDRSGGARRGDADAESAESAGGRGLRSVRGKARDEGPLALERLIHERMRLGILSALVAVDAMSFNDLKRLLRTTDGNLSVHARKLEEASYVTCTKSFEGRVPRTEYAITPAGRRALARYLDHMEAIIRATRER